MEATGQLKVLYAGYLFKMLNAAYQKVNRQDYRCERLALHQFQSHLLYPQF